MEMPCSHNDAAAVRFCIIITEEIDYEKYQYYHSMYSYKQLIMYMYKQWNYLQ